jgi:hypothetical protein
MAAVRRFFFIYGSSCPKDLGFPSGVGWQMYEGTSVPFVNAETGAAAIKATITEAKSFMEKNAW